MVRSGLTLAEACSVLDPPIPLRTLQRLVAHLAPIGVRYTRGRPAAVYDVGSLYELHAAWVVGKSKWRVTDAGRDDAP